MIKGKDLIGLKVISLDRGQVLEKVDEIIYDPTANQVVALVVDPGGWFGEAKIVPFADIANIGPDAVMVPSKQVIKTAKEVEQPIKRIVADNNYLNDNDIVTVSGTRLGKITDIYFDETGRVLEFEVSSGVKDLQSGKKRLAVSAIHKVGEEVTIVSDAAADNFDQPGIKEQISNLGEQAKASAQEKIEEIKQHPQTQKIAAKLKEATSAAQL